MRSGLQLKAETHVIKFGNAWSHRFFRAFDCASHLSGFKKGQNALVCLHVVRSDLTGSSERSTTSCS